MNMTEAVIVRLYLTEGDGQLKLVLKRLRDWEKVRGVTVFRGMEGFGPSGAMHTSKLTDLSLDLPIVVEFFDEPTKIASILEHFQGMFEPGHVVSWPVQMN